MKLSKLNYFLLATDCAGGDQMTAARTRGSQRIRSNSETDVERLEGFTAVVEDWHAKVAFWSE